ncbi:MAG TPA: hypothetical protein VFZ65_11475 [Planctomycetota bacterium]|nr:hypothetical protein [Planctomycetota bacterium]
MSHHRRTATLAVALLASATAPRTQDPGAAPSATDAFAAVKKDYDKAMKDFEAIYAAAKTDEERQKTFSHYPQGETFAPRIVEIVQKWPADPVAVEATNWLLPISSGQVKGLAELFDVLLGNQIDNPKLADTCKAMQYNSVPKGAAFLRTVMQKSPHAEAQGWACYVLAKQIDSEAGLAERLQRGAGKDLVEWLTQSRGEQEVARMKAADPEALRQEGAALLEQVIAKYGDLKAYRKTLGEQAKGDLFELRNLAVGMVAPEIEGTDTDGVAFKLSDYRGKVLFLDFWGFW